MWYKEPKVHDMRSIFSILIVFIGFGLSAQKLHDQQFHANGNIQSTVYSHNGITYIVKFHKNGIMSDESTYVKGRPYGIWKRYNDQGILIAQATFNNGLREGSWLFWNKNGERIGEIIYENGELQKGIRWDGSGEVIARR